MSKFMKKRYSNIHSVSDSDPKAVVPSSYKTTKPASNDSPQTTTTTSFQLTYSVVQTNGKQGDESLKGKAPILDLNDAGDEDDWDFGSEVVEKNPEEGLPTKKDPIPIKKSDLGAPIKERRLEPASKTPVKPAPTRTNRAQPPPPQEPYPEHLSRNTIQPTQPMQQPQAPVSSYGPIRGGNTSSTLVSVEPPYPARQENQQDISQAFYQQYEENLKNGLIWMDRGSVGRVCCTYNCGGIASPRLAHCIKCIDASTDPFVNEYKRRRSTLSSRLQAYVTARCLDRKTMNMIATSISSLTRRVSSQELYNLIYMQVQQNKGKTGISMESAIFLLTRVLSNVTEQLTATRYQNVVSCFIVDFWRIPYGAKDFSFLFKHTVVFYNETISVKYNNPGLDEIDAILYFMCPRLQIITSDEKDIDSIQDTRLGVYVAL